MKRSQHRAMGLPHKMKRRGGPMRGSTPEKVFQTVDVGTASDTQRIIFAKNKADRRGMTRRYAAVDPHYASWMNASMFPHSSKTHSSKIIKITKNKGVEVHPDRVENLFEKMTEEGLKTRHINVDMPFSNVDNAEARAPIIAILENAKKVILPNGNIWVKSEKKEFLEWIANSAKEFGLRSAPIKEIPHKIIRPEGKVPRLGNKPLTWFMKVYTSEPGRPLYSLRITVPGPAPRHASNAQ